MYSENSVIMDSKGVQIVCRLIIFRYTACPKQIRSTILKVIKFVKFSPIYIWVIVCAFHQVCAEVAVMHIKYELFVGG